VRALAAAVEIELPDLDTPPPAGHDPALLAPIGPLYLAHELDQAGLLRTAELIAGLFASGAIEQPLGATAALLHEFWQKRTARLSADERAHLLGQTFEPQVFYPRMERLCAALAAMADNAGVADVHEEVGLEQAAADLAELMAARTGGMLAYAAEDIVGAIRSALEFMRDRSLLMAFGVRDVWGLVATTGAAQGVNESDVRRHVDLARSGAAVLVWLSGAAGGPLHLDPAGTPAQTRIAAAMRWRQGWQPARAIVSREPARV
jgi:hypothetical protein